MAEVADNGSTDEGPFGWERGDAYYQHPGYGFIDHQLNPLMDAIRTWAEPPFGTLEDAYTAIEAVRSAMTQLRRNLKEEATDRAFFSRAVAQANVSSYEDPLVRQAVAEAVAQTKDNDA